MWSLRQQIATLTRNNFIYHKEINKSIPYDRQLVETMEYLLIEIQS